jgi:hypothetical protein
MIPQKIRDQIEHITEDLIELGLCNHQNFPALRTIGSFTEISIAENVNLSIVLKNIPYSEIYAELLGSQCYNLKMIDGALIQMMYRFVNADVSSHRLAFFPSPDLAEFQNNPEIYESDEIFADVVARNIVVFPVRFDFDSSDERFQEIHHSRSHLTLGQYQNCRIPVSAPITPYWFIDFILRNFYNTAHKKYCESIRSHQGCFDQTMTERERRVVYIQAPA